MRTYTFIVILLVILLSACQPTASENIPPTADEGAVQTAIAQTEAARPTETLPPPTATTVPTATEIPATATPANTALPEGIIFRDDFDGSILPEWTIENEIPDRWQISDTGEVVITATDIGIPYVWDNVNDQQGNLFLVPAPDGEFQITTHIKADTFRNFQQAAIYIYEDPDNFILMNRGYCDLCFPGGDGIYLDYKIQGAQGSYKVPVNSDDVYLRLVYKQDRYESYYALEEDQWTRLGMVGGYVKPEKVGFGASNRGIGDDMIASFDFFEVARP